MIEQFAGKQWTEYDVRQSIAELENLTGSAEDGALTIGSSNLMLLLQGKIYEDYACNSVTGLVSRSSLVGIQNAVRARVLELTIELEKSMPGATEIAVGGPVATPIQKDREIVTQITKQTIYGNVTTISSSGERAQINVSISQGDSAAFVKALARAGPGNLHKTISGVSA